MEQGIFKRSVFNTYLKWYCQHLVAVFNSPGYVLGFGPGSKLKKFLWKLFYDTLQRCEALCLMITDNLEGNKWYYEMSMISHQALSKE